MKLMVMSALVGMVAGSLDAEGVRVYVGTQGSGESKGIYRTTLDPATGSLAEPVLAAEMPGAGFLVLSADGRHLYSTARAGKADSVAGFAVREDGGLTLTGTQPSQGRGPCFVGLDATGKVLLAANYGSGGVAAFPIGADGTVGASTSHFEHEGSSVNTRRQEGPHAHSFYAGPDNRYAYAPDLGIDEVVIYALDAEKAALKPAGAAKMPPGSGPRHLKFGKDGKQAYVLSELTLTVVVFDRDAESGMLEQQQVVSVLPEGGEVDGMTCSEILVSPNGKFVYTANRDTAGKGRDTLSVLAVGEGGALRHVQTVPAEVEIPRNINLSPDGKWLLVAGQKSGGVPVFGVGEDGKLTFSGKRAEVPNAMCVVFSE